MDFDAVDIGELVPGLDDALGLDAVDDSAPEPEPEAEEKSLNDAVSEIVDENVSEDDPQIQQEPDNGPQEDTVLDQAIARLRALEAENSTLKTKVDEAAIANSMPRWIPYSKLPDDVRARFDQAAEEAEVPPEVLVREAYTALCAEREAEVRQVMAERQNMAQSVLSHIDAHFDNHPLRQQYGNDVFRELGEAGMARVLQLVEKDPHACMAAAIAMIDATYKKVEVAKSAQERKQQQQQRLKAASKPEASRPQSTPTPKTQTRTGADEVKEIYDFIKSQASPLDSLFR